MSESVIEDAQPSKKIIHVKVSQDEFNKIFENNLIIARKSLKLPGFRSGKVPKRLVLEKMKDDLQKESVEKTVEKSFKEAMAKWNIYPVSQPILSNFKNEKDLPFTFDLTVDVKPEVSIKEYKGLKLKKITNNIDDEEIDHAIEHLRETYAKTAQTDRPSKKGDLLTINFAGYNEAGKKIEGASGKSFLIEIGSKKMIPGFEENLIDLKVGDKKSFSIKFPVNYNKNLAGKTVRFDVEIKKIAEKKPPELNAEFAKTVDPKYKNMQELKEEIKKELVKQKDEKNKTMHKETIFEQLMAKNPFDIPESMLVSESNNMINSYIRNVTYRGVDIEGKEEFKYKSLRKKFDPIAEKRVKSTFIVLDIAEKEKISVSNSEIAEEISKEAAYYGKDPKTVYKDAEKNGRIPDIRILKLEEKVSDFILKNAEIVDETIQTEKETEREEKN